MKTHQSRRRFLRNAALTAAGAFGFPTIIKAASAGASRKLTVGCVGLGQMGTGNLGNFLGLNDCQVVAVCDVQADRREKAKVQVNEAYGTQGCSAFNDYRELLGRADIDAVMIATPDHWHALIATEAAIAGKDLYLEKPLGVSVAEGRAIREAVRHHKRVFQAGTHQRSSGKFRQACELVRSGYVGRLREIRVVSPGGDYQPRYAGPLDPQPVPDGFDWTLWQGPAPQKPFNPGRVVHPDWYLQWDYCAGFICNWGVHYLDIAHWGAPELGKESFEVECRGAYRQKGFSDNLEGWRAQFTFAGGLRMDFSDLPEKSPETGTKFVGDEGWVHVNRAGIWAEPASLLRISPGPGWQRLANWDDPARDIRTGKAGGVEVPVFTSTNHAQDFIECMRSRRDPISNVDANDVASNLGLIAEISARLGTKLKWDAKAERFMGNDAANARLHRPHHNGWKLAGVV